MTWDTVRIVAAVLFGIFAVILLVVPTMQIVRGRLRTKQLWGFLVAGIGFAMLAFGITIVPAANGQTLIIAGVVLTVIGNLAQQSIMRDAAGRGRR